MLKHLLILSLATQLKRKVYLASHCDLGSADPIKPSPKDPVTEQNTFANIGQDTAVAKAFIIPKGFNFA